MRQISAQEKDPRNALHFAGVLLISFGLLCFVYAVDRMFRWCDPVRGFLSGLTSGWIMFFPWLLFVLPWSLGVGLLYRMCGWQRFRSFWMLIPAFALMVLGIGELILDPPSIPKRFAYRAKIPFPEKVENLQVYFSGGGFADVTDWYYFETSPQEVERLIAGMNLLELSETGNPQSYGHKLGPLSGIPAPETWPGVRYYQAWDDSGLTYFLLTTDENRTRILLIMGSI